jgi:RNA polymerase primary sigma factor
MIGGLCESPLTMRAIVHWRGALMDGKMLRRVRGCSGRRWA